MIIDRKIRIGKSRKNDVKRYRLNISNDYTTKPKKPTKRMKSILPILFKLKNIEVYRPEQVLEILGLVLEKDTTKFISSVEKEQLKNYLYKWGYDNSWVD